MDKEQEHGSFRIPDPCGLRQDSTSIDSLPILVETDVFKKVWPQKDKETPPNEVHRLISGTTEKGTFLMKNKKKYILNNIAYFDTETCIHVPH